MDFIKTILVFGFLFYLISLLYVLPSYFRRLGELIQYLNGNQSEVYLALGKPTLSMLDMNIRGTIALVMFVLRKKYLELGDSAAIELGNAARWRLIYSMLPAVVPPIAFAAAILNKVN